MKKGQRGGKGRGQRKAERERERERESPLLLGQWMCPPRGRGSIPTTLTYIRRWLSQWSGLLNIAVRI